MRFEVDSLTRLQEWMSDPRPAIFQGLDLTAESERIASLPLNGCAFLGCTIAHQLTVAAASAGCTVIPGITGVPFDAFRAGLYTPDELYDEYDPDDSEASYKLCLDRRIYESVIDPKTRDPLPADALVTIARRLHDASIAEALDDVMDVSTRKRTVAIMGGHDSPRDEPLFAQVATLCLKLAQSGYLVVTAGGPGLMEAANLGAYTAGFDNSEQVLEKAIEGLKAAPTYNDPRWLSAGYRTWKAMGTPVNTTKSLNIGIPTWFYGHEPPNVFSTQIAKYFENSVREEGLLAVALAGVVFAKGNAGTVQELFQDACQNYYKTYDKWQSPMILLGSDYWAPSPPLRVNYGDRRKPVYQLVEKLACEKGFADRLLLTDDLDTAIQVIKTFSPISE